MRKGYILRLYPYYDIDLLMLAQDPNTKFSSICKQALKAYVRGYDYKIDSIKPTTESGSGLKAEKRRLDICIKFDSFKDRDILDFLNTVNKGYKNLFIKNLLRAYMGGIDLSIFFYKYNNKKVIISENDRENAISQENLATKTNTLDEQPPIPTKTASPSVEIAQSKVENKRIVSEEILEQPRKQPEAESITFGGETENISNANNLQESSEQTTKSNNMLDSFLDSTSLF